jgi:hypothetical protein
MSSVSVNPCWVFLMGAQSEGLLRAPARPSDQWLPPADQRSCVVNWITLAASLNEGHNECGKGLGRRITPLADRARAAQNHCAIKLKRCMVQGRTTA